MFQRTMQKELKEAAIKLPIVTLLGPRQSGKTTLVKETFPHKPYVNMESTHLCRMAADDPLAFLAQYPKGAILDEIQEVLKTKNNEYDVLKKEASKIEKLINEVL